MLRSAREVIKEIGGTREVAALTGVGLTTVREWARLGDFPAWWADLMEKALAKKSGKKADPVLWRMRR